MDPKDIPRLLLALEQGFETVIASRFIQGGERHDRDRRFAYRSTGNRVFTLLANLLFYGNTSDSLSQFRGIKRSCLNALEIDELGFGAAYQMTIRSIQKGFRVKEIPSVEKVRVTGEESRKAWRSVFPLLCVMLREWKRTRKVQNVS